MTMLETLTNVALSMFFMVVGAFGWYVADKKNLGWVGGVGRIFETVYGKIWK